MKLSKLYFNGHFSLCQHTHMNCRHFVWSINYWIIVITVQISKVLPLDTNVYVQTIISNHLNA
jgi:hypothetical protein